MGVRVGEEGKSEGEGVESATADANGAHFTEKTEKGRGHGDAVVREQAR